MRLSKCKTLLAAALAVTISMSCISSANAALSRKAEDNLFFASSTEPLGLDPALVDDMDSGNLIVGMYESLLRFKHGSTEVEPCLAESWTISDDGLVYTFKLRQGVKFHDGTPFNAEAVKFNFDRQSPEHLVPKMSYAPFVFGDVAKTEVLDEYTVQVTLKQRQTPFLRNMAMTYAAPIASPTALKKFNNNLMENPCGTGPYKFVAWDKGQQIIMTTNEDYWGQKPAVQNVIYRIMKDTSARVVALNNGEVDVINGVDANVVDELKKGGSEIYMRDGMSTNYMFYNTREGYVTADPEVRKAISQAINVPELVNTLYKGYSDYAKTYFPDLMAGNNDKIAISEYNPEEAKKVLEQKGVKTLKIITYTNARPSNTAGGLVLAEAIQAYLAKVGVKAEINALDWNTYRAKTLTDAWDMGFTAWGSDNGDADNFINILATNDPIVNQGLWLDPEFIECIKDGLKTPDGAERVAIYQKAEELIAQKSPILPISHAKELMAHSPKVKGELIHMSVVRFVNMSKSK